MNLKDLYIPYVIPAIALTAALVPRIPSIIRAWKDPGLRDLRTVGGLLVLAISVFVVATPHNLALQNRLIGVPNIAAPITYSLLSCFSASCLALLITWREEDSPRRTRKIRWVWGVYIGVIAGLWLTFSLADMHVERLHDLDTYYANTPWAREHILLYLLAHTASAFVASWLILTWVNKVDRWLRAGLVSMLIGYIIGVGYDVVKVTAVGARWAGDDLDWLSTDVAPPFAATCAIFVALGFLIPQLGPVVQARWETRASFRVLRPLWRAVSEIRPQVAIVDVHWWSSYELRLMERQSHISDGFLALAPYFNDQLRERVYQEATQAGHADTEARGIAGAADVLTAIARYKAAKPDGDTTVPLSDDFRDMEPISRALRNPAAVERYLHAAEQRV